MAGKKKNPFGIKRPGRMKKLAARHGVSLGKEIEKDVHSPNASLRDAAVLGRSFRSGKIGKAKRRKPKGDSKSARDRRMENYQL